MNTFVLIVAVLVVLVILYYAYIFNRYTYIGIYNDAPERVMPTNEDKGNPLLDGAWYERTDTINKCYQVAKNQGDKYFAVQAGGYCSSSSSTDYDKLGAASDVDLTNKYAGGPWINAVYKVNY